VVEILEAASDEMEEAADYYEGCRDGLGARFILEARRAFTFIEETPQAGAPVLHPKVPEGVRRVFLDSFPYAVVYVEPELVVVAVAHLRRRPAYWALRVGQMRSRS
jgi:hypothetical protein